MDDARRASFVTSIGVAAPRVLVLLVSACGTSSCSARLTKVEELQRQLSARKRSQLRRWASRSTR